MFENLVTWHALISNLNMLSAVRFTAASSSKLDITKGKIFYLYSL